MGLRSEAHLEAHLLKPADFLDLVGLVGLGGLFQSLLPHARARTRVRVKEAHQAHQAHPRFDFPRFFQVGLRLASAEAHPTPSIPAPD